MTTTAYPSVLIVGAGLTGLTLAYKYRELGIPFTVLEKASEVGGTWRDNVYPGVGLDTAAATYCLSFAEKYDWSVEHPPGGEVQEYLRTVARDLRLNDHIRFNTEVVECRWLDGHWEVDLASGERLESDMLVMATGFLRVPSVPSFPGREEFTGPQFHSAEWDRSFDPVGKRIGVIGTGSSGMQITTALSEMDCEVTQVIRTPQWIHTRPNRRHSALERWLYRRFPAYGRRVTLAREARTKQTDPKLLKNGDWRRFPGAARDLAFQAFRDDLEQHIHDPELREKMTPSDNPGCKRIPLAPDYYAAIARPNVEIVRGGVERITATGLVDSYGVHHELDAIVYATGFDSHAYFKPIKIYGLTGEDLGERWSQGGPDIYLSLMAPDYPNLFVLHGPYSAINSIPIPLSTVEMVDYTIKVAEHVAATGNALSPTVAATKSYLSWVQDAMDGTIWSSGCDSWYKTDDGQTIVWPFGREEHTTMLADLGVSDFSEVPALMVGGVR